MRIVLIYFFLLGQLAAFAQPAKINAVKSSEHDKNYPEHVAAINKLKTSAQQHLFGKNINVYLAEKELQEALVQSTSIGYDSLKSVYDLLAQVNRQKSDIEKELFFEFQSLKIREASGDTSDINESYSRIAITYTDMGQYEKSRAWMGKAFSINKKRNDIDDLYVATGLIVYDFIAEKTSQKAIDFLHAVVKETPPMSIVQKVMVNESYGNCYQSLQEYGKAEEHYLKMIPLNEEYLKIDTSSESAITSRMHIYKTIASFYINSRQFEKAKIYVNKMMQMPNGVIRPLNMSKISLMQFKIDSALGNYADAIKQFQKYKSLNDSVFSESKSKQIAEIQVKYETEQKEKDLQLLNSKQLLLQNELQKSKLARNLTFALAIVLIALIAIGYNRYRLKQKSNMQLAIKQEEINTKNKSLGNILKEKDELINEKDILLEEKEWLMKEIHHRVKNNLQIVMSLLNSQSALMKDEAAKDAIRESQHRVHAISLIHQKLYQSENLSLINMEVYVKDVIEYLADNLDAYHRIRFDVAVDPIQLDVSQAVPLGLIVNEAVTNAIKYAFPKKNNGIVSIAMKETFSEVASLSICDNGIGLPENFDWRTTQSLGMSLMRGLCKQMDGTFEIVNEEGTAVQIKFMVEKNI